MVLRGSLHAISHFFGVAMLLRLAFWTCDFIRSAILNEELSNLQYISIGLLCVFAPSSAEGRPVNEKG